jgi:hypothetical protein
MTKHIYCLSFLACFLFSACKSSIEPEELYGKWNYTKLENPNQNPPRTEPDWKLKIEKPYILFTKNNNLEIWWSGELLSHGKFRTKDNDIWFNEVLDGGQKREFPFHVTQLTDKTIVFETSGDDGSRVTAVKQ